MKIVKNITLPFFLISFVFFPRMSYGKNNHLLDNSDTLRILLDSARYYNNIGVDYWYEADYDKAEIFLTKALKIKKQIFQDDQQKIASTYLNLGLLYTDIWKFDKALENYSETENILLKQKKNKNNFDMGTLYLNLGNLYIKIGDYQKAINYSNKALSIYKNETSKYPEEIMDTYQTIALIYNNLGICQSRLANYKTAIFYYKNSIALSENFYRGYLGIPFSNLANVYKKLKDYNEAAKYYKLSIEYYKKSFGKNYYNLGSAFNNYALLLSDRNKSNSALTYFQKAYSIYLSNIGPKHPRTANCLLNIGNLYAKEHQYPEALKYYQKSIIALVENFNDSDIYINPSVKKIPNNLELLSSLKEKAKSLAAYFKTTQEVRDLKTALETYEICIHMLDKIKNQYQTRESKLLLSEHENDTYSNAIKAAFDLYTFTRDDKYKTIAFEYAEKSKAANLLAAIRDLQARNFGGVPPALLQKEKDLNRDIAFYSEQVYEEKRRNNPDRKKLGIWEDKLFSLNKDHEDLVHLLEKNYPRYYSLKYDNSVVSTRTLSGTLGHNKVILEYILSDSCLYTFLIDNKGLDISSQPIDSSFYLTMKGLLRSLQNFDFTSHTSNDFYRYIDQAYGMYQYLIAPYIERIAHKQIIIIPDKQLAYIPFEALVENDNKPDRIDYKDLPYLLKDFEISYSYSGTLLYSYHPADKNKKDIRLLAFAPTYPANPGMILPKYQTRQRYRKHLYPIPGAEKEVNIIHSIFHGDVFEGNQATERKFKAIAENYDVIHLAMHTIIDNKNPMYSKLAFVDVRDSTEDGLLNTHEIYNMNFKAELAVLSSCSSGDGQMYKGEGVISLARGFSYAGCKSIVMSLWEVEDESSVKIMSYYYRELKTGKSKNEALHDAKLKFLKEAGPVKAHPYFWSTFIGIGDQAPLFRERHNTPYIISAIILFLMIPVVIVIRRKKQKNIS